jgi:phage FluMu gp28-like protein
MSLELTQQEWAEARRSAVAIMPELVAKLGLPKALLTYQSHVVKLLETAGVEVLFIEKSRRIGLTWGFASYAVLKAARQKKAGGMDVMYISYAQDMTREFIDACAMWAKAYSIAASDAEEFLFDDETSEGTKSIQAFRIKFASGFEIIGLSSAPRTLRGKQGVVMIDEAAFVDNLAELLKAALAFLMWGGQVVVCSTHNGFDNHFNDQIQQILAGKLPYEHVKIDFDSALRDGLYQRICFVTGKTWTPELEAEWRAKIYKFYASGADEELRCIPSASSGSYLSLPLIMARQKKDIPVIRWHPPQGFVDWPEEARKAEAETFCKGKLLPHLVAMNPRWRSCFGEDFGRNGDLTCIHPVQIRNDQSLSTPFVLELRDVPFTSQWQILEYIATRLPRFSHGALDARGNGAYLAEQARQKFGVSMITEVQLSTSWYIANMPRLKSAFEDGTFEIPMDDDIRADYRLLQMEKGVAKVPDSSHTEGQDGHARHGDTAIAGCLAVFASVQDGGKVGVGSTGQTRPVQETLADFVGIDNGGNLRADFSAFLRM